MSSIHLLSDLLINQIAAGEVVERPASALKELLENSLDAGSGEVSVQLQQGGVKSLRVADNGAGIDRDQLQLALSRHATSKIASLDDLESVRSLGFRGEALASIAAVSRLALTSRKQGERHAWRMEAAGGDISGLQPAALEAGTVAEMQDLYFNTPARRKFLKTEATEYGHCEETFRRMALSRADVSFGLQHNGRRIWQLPAASLMQRATALLGEEFAAAAVPVDEGAGGLRLHGLAGLPGFSRGSRDAQYVYVNGRFVRDKLIAHAIREAYRDIIHHDRHPAFVLFIELAPEMVDVNVHPTKIEVRFRESRAVHQLIYHALNKSLAAPIASRRSELPQPQAPFASAPLYATQTRMPLGVEERSNLYHSLFGQIALHMPFYNYVAYDFSNIGGEDDVLHAEVAQHSDAPAQIVEHAIHVAAGLGDVVLFAEFINLLGGDQDQLGGFDPIPHLLRRFGQQIVQLGVEDRHARMLFQEGHTVLAILQHRAADL